MNSSVVQQPSTIINMKLVRPQVSKCALISKYISVPPTWYSSMIWFLTYHSLGQFVIAALLSVAVAAPSNLGYSAEPQITIVSSSDVRNDDGSSKWRWVLLPSIPKPVLSKPCILWWISNWTDCGMFECLATPVRTVRPVTSPTPRKWSDTSRATPTKDLLTTSLPKDRKSRWPGPLMRTVSCPVEITCLLLPQSQLRSPPCCPLCPNWWTNTPNPPINLSIDDNSLLIVL